MIIIGDLAVTWLIYAAGLPGALVTLILHPQGAKSKYKTVLHSHTFLSSTSGVIASILPPIILSIIK